MCKPIRCFYRPGEIRDLSSDSPMDMSTPEPTQADTTTSGQRDKTSLEVTASPYQSTFRLIKMTPLSQSLASEPAGSLLTTTTRDTTDTTTSETIVNEFTDQLSWKPSPPVASKTPVADPTTLRTLLGLAQLLKDARSTPISDSSAHCAILSNNMKRSRSPSSGPVSRTRLRVEATSEVKSEDEDELFSAGQVQCGKSFKRRHEGESDEEPESPMLRRRKIESKSTVEESLKKTTIIDLQQNNLHALPLEQAEEIGKIEVAPSPSPLRRRLQLWEKYVIEQYEQAEGDVEDNLEQLMSAVLDNIRDICIDDVDEDEDEE
ncbi:hypothetical protein EW145_g7099 [Phellinidium pouzarii]|uniref:Uncharacterized protein n=1 Tax=Phellinidium pouzarii TaxID=167371 RepID=A0A4S4KR11_9AGAM|nr:hypothetical protein EW145_g7099 [Phellinidium pouzarii]